MDITDAEGAVPYELLRRASIELSDFSVAFATLVDNETVIDANLSGSGTLISLNGRYAVLTADHVLENLPNRGEVGLILPTRFTPRVHRPTVDMELAQKVRIARGSVPAEGPDIGVLLLPMPTVSTIRAAKSFYALGSRTNREQVPTERGFWLINGMAHEWTSDTDPEHGYQRAKIFRGISGVGIIGQEWTAAGFDYIGFQTRYDELYEGPRSYEGFSGGGLWQIMLARTPAGELIIHDKILSGVIFYQSALENGSRTIVCHGRQSVYRAVVDAVQRAT